ncbi:uncharacterized protein [Paramisgurnus dabryanus]|uniref:uncharacterized protein isoform X2 n=1 Tax=Paramisgurnus dabryanus TaxID=90735 RepID=UPI0031F477A2
MMDANMDAAHMWSTCEMKKYCGVLFTEENAVNVVPSKWLKEGKCYWPGYLSDEKNRKAGIRCEEPGPGWKLFNVRVLFQKDEYTAATLKLKEYLKDGTECLQSESEEDPKRRRKENSRYDSDSDPIVVSKGTMSKGTVKEKFPSHLALPAVPPLPPLPNCDNYQEHTLTDISWSVRKESAQAGISASGPSMDGERREQGFFFRPSVRVSNGTGPIRCTEAQLHGLLLLENIKQQVTQLATTVNIVLNRLTTEGHPNHEMPEEFQFPIDSEGELQRLEEWLRDPANDRKKHAMVISLSSVGGVDVKRVTWNILAKMFSCAVAKKVNWKGVHGKFGFQKMASKTILTRAVRKCPVTAQVTDTEIHQCAIRWFALAHDREGGRSKRQRQREEHEASY